jgi:phosphatidylserine/phosphatidylglycerophosphate/cardiolipin synthase-like enzyme
MRRLHHPNITYYGFTGDSGMTHAKLYLFDDRWTTIGSLNVFELECMMQKEINIFSDDPDLVAQLKRVAEADLIQSVPLAVPHNGFWRFTHTLTYAFYSWWLKRLISNPTWRARYC